MFNRLLIGVHSIDLELPVYYGVQNGDLWWKIQVSLCVHMVLGILLCKVKGIGFPTGSGIWQALLRRHVTAL